eukprot:UN12111
MEEYFGMIYDGTWIILTVLYDWKFTVILALALLWRCLQPSKGFPHYENARIEDISSVSQYVEFLKENKYAIVKFYAEWCPPCRNSSVPFGKMSEEFSDRGWKFGKVNMQTYD